MEEKMFKTRQEIGTFVFVLSLFKSNVKVSKDV